MRMSASLRFVVMLICFSALIVTISCGGGGGGSTTPPPPPPPATPTISSLSPASATVGGASFTLSVNGTGFASGASVLWNGTAKTTTFLSSTQLQAAITQADIAGAGSVNVTVTSGGRTSTASTFTVSNPAPAIVSISPSPMTVNHAATAMTITGTGFVPSSVIVWNGVNRATTFVSNTQLQTTIDSQDVTTPGTARISVHNGAPGGGDATAMDVPVEYAAPAVSLLSPPAATAGGAGFTLTVNGTGFAAASEVRWNGVKKPTTFVSTASLKASIDAADIAAAGTATITVYTPTPGGGTSVGKAFTIGSIPTPVITYLYPSSVYANAPDTAITVAGSGILQGATVQFNGTDLPTAYSSGYLGASIPAASLKTVGINTVTVTNAGIGAKASHALNFEVKANPVPAITYITPSAAPVGSAAVKISLSGNNFVPKSMVRYNGVDLATTYDGYYLSATIPASQLQQFGNTSITVFNPAPGGGESLPVNFSTYLPLPTNDLVYNAKDGLLYATVPSTAGTTLGNSVVSIDPYSGTLGTPMWVGSEPTKLALSDDGSTLWVALDGASSVRKIDLKTNTVLPGQVFFSGNAYVGNGTFSDLAAVPGTTNSVAASWGGVLTIVDDTTKRAKTAYASQLAFGTSATTLYGFQSNYYDNFSIFTLDSTGVASAQNISGNSGSSSDLKYDAGRLYMTSGAVFDATTGVLLGTFAARGPVAPDSTVGRAFILNVGSQYGSAYDRITAFDVDTMVPVGSMPLSGVTSDYYGSSTSLVCWGQNGLAVRTATQIYLFRSDIVRDLSGSSTDLAASITAPTTATTGTNVSSTVTIKNQGSKPATNVVLVNSLLSGAIFVSATPSQGSCNGTAILRCNLGPLASGASATVQVTVTPTTAGTATSTATVSAAEPDPDTSNNSATASSTVTGADYYAKPSLSSILPAAVRAGTDTFTLAVTGSGFSSGSIVNLGSSSLPTTFVSDSQLTATVDKSNVATLGWATVSVTTPSPGGGTSNGVPLTVYQVISLDTNGLAFDPFTRKIWASIPSTATQVTGNSLVDIDPAVGRIGTPVNIGSEPGRLSLSDNGQYLYTVLGGSSEVRRMDVPSRTAGTRFTTLDAYKSPYTVADIAVMPGHPDTIATVGDYRLQAYDIVDSTVTPRAAAPLYNAGAYVGWTDSSHLFTTDSYLYRYSADSTSLTYIDGNYMPNFNGRFSTSNGLLYSEGGMVVDPSPAKPAAPQPVGKFASNGPLAVDGGMRRAFFFVGNSYSTSQLGIAVYDMDKYLQTDYLSMPVLSDYSYGRITDLVRWGRDGLAFRIYDTYNATPGNGTVLLVRGPIVTPRIQITNTKPSLSSVAPNSATAGSGNLWVTVTGSGFVPGAVVQWNGQERTTQFVDATTLKAAVAAADVRAAASVSVTVANPNSAASSAVSFTVTQ